MRLRSRLAVWLVALACLVLALAQGAAGQSTVTLRASQQQTRGGQRVTLSGQASGAPAGTVVKLYASRYPYPVASLAATAATG